MKISIEKLVAEFIVKLAEVSKEYPKAMEGYGRTFSVELFDYGTLPLSVEDIDFLVNILDSLEEDDPKEIFAKAIAERFEDEINIIAYKASSVLKDKALNKISLMRRKMFSQHLNLRELAHTYMVDNFTLDLDNFEVVRTIMEYQNPHAFVERLVQSKKTGKWEDITSPDYFVLNEEAFKKLLEYNSELYTIYRGEDRLVVTAEEDNSRVVYIYTTDLYDYFAKAKWYGSVITDPNYIFNN